MEIQLYGALVCLVVVLALVGAVLMTAAFGTAIWRRNGDKAMKPDERGKWPFARKLMLTGASLGVVVGVLCLVLIEWGNQLFGN